jgi:hypothetical protein
MEKDKQPLYSHDGNGTTIHGDKGLLIKKINTGAKIRLVYKEVESDMFTSWEPLALFTKNGEAFAQVGIIGSEWRPPEESLQFINGHVQIFMNFSTSGKTCQRVISLDRNVSDHFYRHGLAWYEI